MYKTEQTIPWLACAAAGYQNSCTLKNICFGGPDGNYVLSGSDDFSVLMWKLPKQDELDELPSPDYRSLRVIPLRETARSNKISSPGVDIDSMFSIDDCCLAELSSRGIPVIDTPQVRLGAPLVFVSPFFFCKLFRCGAEIYECPRITTSWT